MTRWLLAGLLSLATVGHSEVLNSVTGTFGTFANAASVLPNQVDASVAKGLVIYGDSSAGCTACTVRVLRCCAGTCVAGTGIVATLANPAANLTYWDSESVGGGSLACIIGVDSTGCTTCTSTIKYRLLKWQ